MKKPGHLISLAALACFGLCASGSLLAQEAVTNGNFSSNGAAYTAFPGYSGGSNPAAPDGWTITGNNVGINNASGPFGPTNKSAATYYCFLQSAGAATSQELTLLPNTTYNISFLAGNRAGNNNAAGRVVVADATTTYYNSGVTNWGAAAFQLVTAQFTSPATIDGTVTITLSNNSPAGDNTVCYSNVFVAAVPPLITTVTIEDVSSELGSPSFSRLAVNSINGNGLNSNGPGTHSTVPDGNMWLSQGVFRAPTDPLPAVITFDLGVAHNLDLVRVWNYNEINLPSRGSKDVEILVADTVGGAFTSLGNFVFSRAPGANNVDFSQVIDLSLFPAAENARLVRFNIATNWNGDNQFVGLSEVQFEGTEGPDTTAPGIVSRSPADNSTGAYVGANLVLTFNEGVALTGTGTVTLKNLGDGSGSSDITFNLPDAAVVVSGKELIIDPPSNLAVSTNYAVRISGDAVQDLAASPNSFAGISNDTTWNFQTANNPTPPVITSYNPVDGEAFFVIAPLVATFDESVFPGNGNVILRNLDDGFDQVINVTDVTQVSVSGNILTIQPTTLPVPDKAYAVLIDAGALTNNAGTPFAGIAGDTTWNFTPANVVTLFEEGFESPDITPAQAKSGNTNGNLHSNVMPSTSRWVGSTNGFGAGARGLDDEGTGYFTDPVGQQAFHFRYTNSGVTTAPGAIGSLLPGFTYTFSFDVVRDGYNGGLPFNGGLVVYDPGDIRTDVRGSFTNGGGELLANTSGNATTDGAYTRKTVTFTPTAAHSGLLGKDLAIRFIGATSSATIDNVSVIVSRQAAAPPSLVSFDDNVPGGLVTLPNPVVYTVTFGEAMNAGSIGTDDFENGVMTGAAGITVDSVNATADPAVYEVIVTTVSGGDLKLQVKAGAVIYSAAAGTLDTTSAIPDDTTLTVPVTVISITRQDGSSSNGPTVSWLVTFDGSVTGLSASNFSLVSSGLTGAGGISVAPGAEPEEYIVTANSGTGCGTLNLVLDDGLTGVSPPIDNVPFTGVDAEYAIDTLAPVISCAKQIVVTVPEGQSATVSYAPTAFDECEGVIPVVCDPPSPGTFPVGNHVVECTATDSAGNEATASFNVVVLVQQPVNSDRTLDGVSVRGDSVAAGDGISPDAVILAINSAFLNDGGDVVFDASLQGNGANNSAVFRRPEGGTPAPVAVKGASFGAGAYGIFSHLSLNDAGDIGFQSLTSGNLPGHFAGPGAGPVANSARRLGASPSGGVYNGLYQPALASNGELLTPAALLLGNGGVTSLNDSVITSSAGTVVAREGSPSGIGAINHGQFLARVVASDADGRYAFPSLISESPPTGGNAGIFVGQLGGSPTLAVRKGDAAAGTPGTFSSFLGESVNSDGEIALRAFAIGGGITAADNEGIWTNSGNASAPPVLVAREGDVAPCIAGGMVAFSSFGTIYMGDDGSVCFLAYLKDSDAAPFAMVNASNDASIWLWRNGALDLIVREGDLANSTDGAVVGRIVDFDSNGDADGGNGIAYSVEFAPISGDTTSRTNQAVYVDRGGEDLAPVLVLRRGDKFTVGEDEVDVLSLRISSAQAYTPSGSTGGFGRAINGDGDVLLNVGFTGSKSGIFVLGSPPVVVPD